MVTASEISKDLFEFSRKISPSFFEIDETGKSKKKNSEENSEENSNSKHKFNFPAPPGKNGKKIFRIFFLYCKKIF